MNKWAFFTMGIMTGIILFLACMLVMQNNNSNVYASPMPQDVGGGSGTVLTNGGTQQNQNDLVWVMYRRPAKNQDGSGDKVTGDFKLTLCAYKIGSGSKGTMSLVGARDISYDVEIVEWPRQTPSVLEIKKQLEDQSKKKKGK